LRRAHGGGKLRTAGYPTQETSSRLVAHWRFISWPNIEYTARTIVPEDDNEKAVPELSYAI
jgi:hypothetical protein